jgi:hypothetical protein
MFLRYERKAAHVITIPFATLLVCVYNTYFKFLSPCRKLRCSKPGTGKSFSSQKHSDQLWGPHSRSFAMGKLGPTREVKGQGQ